MFNVGNQITKSKQLEGNACNLISMYNEAPVEGVSLDEFEEYSIDRLRVLKEMDAAQVGKNKKEYGMKMDKILNAYLPLRGRNTASEPDRAKRDKLKDQLSHFILRMAFCQQEDLRRWFLTAEVQLFRYRLRKTTKEDKLAFMKRNGLNYPMASLEEVQNRKVVLKMARDGVLHDMAEKVKPLEMYFKIPFTDALELVAGRKVYLEKGIAYVSVSQVISILSSRFRANLSMQLAVAFKRLPNASLARDERLHPVLTNLVKHHVEPSFSSGAQESGGSIRPEMLDQLCNTSMPLCMQNLHQALRKDHHLKHAGRMQYGLFLKGIGLNMEDAIAFWRQEFTRKMSVEDFNKKYAYNIRHNYGKEGKRKDYTPYNCSKIISGAAPRAGESHGCPYRCHSETQLRNQLSNIDNISRQKIIQLSKGQHYQIACKRHFEALHSGANSNEVGSHPNSFFSESQNVLQN